jgi:hypothetical protein
LCLAGAYEVAILNESCVEHYAADSDGGHGGLVLQFEQNVTFQCEFILFLF